MEYLDETSKELVEEIMQQRYALRDEAIRKEKQEKNIFRKILKKLLTLFQ